MHVLVIPSWYPETADDLVGSFFREQALALLNQNVTVGVLVSKVESLRNFSITRLFSSMNVVSDCGLLTIRKNTFNWLPKTSSFKKHQHIRAGLRAYDFYCKKYGTPDVIHAQSTLYGAVIASEIHIKTGTPYFVTEHSSAYMRDTLEKKFLIELFRKHLRNACQLYAVSPALAESLKKYGNLPWSVHPNSVNNIFFEQSKPSTLSNKFIHIANLNENKGTKFLIDAFHTAFKETDVKLEICGKGPELNKLKQIVQNYGLENNVHFTGEHTRSDIAKKMAESIAVVISSYNETFSLVAAESLAVGTPVISTRCGGPEYIVDYESGYLVDCGNKKQLTRALKMMYLNFPRFNSVDIKTKCYERFAEKVLANKLIQSYKSALE